MNYLFQRFHLIAPHERSLLLPQTCLCQIWTLIVAVKTVPGPRHRHLNSTSHHMIGSPESSLLDKTAHGPFETEVIL